MIKWLRKRLVLIASVIVGFGATVTTWVDADSFDFKVLIMGLLFGAIAGLPAWIIERKVEELRNSRAAAIKAIREEVLPPKPQLEADLETLSELVKAASTIFPRIEAELAARSERTAELVSRAAAAQATVQIHETTARQIRSVLAEAVDQHMAQRFDQLDKGSRYSQWRAFWAGIMVAIPIGILVNWISHWFGWQ